MLTIFNQWILSPRNYGSWRKKTSFYWKESPSWSYSSSITPAHRHHHIKPQQSHLQKVILISDAIITHWRLIWLRSRQSRWKQPQSVVTSCHFEVVRRWHSWLGSGISTLMSWSIITCRLNSVFQYQDRNWWEAWKRRVWVCSSCMSRLWLGMCRQAIRFVIKQKNKMSLSSSSLLSSW